MGLSLFRYNAGLVSGPRGSLPALFGRLCAQGLLAQRRRAPRAVAGWVSSVLFISTTVDTCELPIVASDVVRVFSAYFPRILHLHYAYSTRMLHVHYM